MIAKYDSKGRVVEEMLPRNQFPRHAEMTAGAPEIGFAALGYEDGTLWFWLPDSTDLVTVRTDSGSVSRASTGLPHGVPPRSLMRLPSGNVLAETVERRPGDGTLAVLTYVWSPATKQSTAFTPPACSDHTLIGVAGEEILADPLVP